MAELPPHDHAARRDRLRARLGGAGIDALYVTAAENVRYLTGFTGSNGQVVVAADGGDLLITDARYEARAAREAPGLAVDLTRDPARAALEHVAPGRLGFEGDHLSHRDGTDLQSAAGERLLEVISVAGAVEALRIVKDASELAAITEACRITGEALRALLEVLRPGMTEREVAIRLERDFVDRGADGVAFPSIVASGPNGAVPHHGAGSRRIESGDLVTIDCGALVAGYHADMTRTVAVGEPSAELRAVHALVQEAQQAGVDAAVAGATTDAVDAAARGRIVAAGHGEHFLHGIGHGVGLRIHEAPWFHSEATATLPPATVITVEPGVYLAGTGGVRIEDTLVVSADGPPVRLTAAPHELLVL